MTCSAAAAALSFAAAAAAPAPHPAARTAKTASHTSAKKQQPKLSKWQLHVLQELKVAAPGDEYFGRMKMSYLGINNTFHDDAIRAGAYTTDPRLIGHVSFADEALTAWSKKYPNDPQLARSYFLAFQLYRKVWTPDGQQKAWSYANIVIQKWPSSFFGKALKKDISIGFTEHYFATAVPCPAITPAASPTPRGATPTPSPSPSPSPTPTPTPAPGQPKVDILPVPCLTPTPSPSPVPTGSLSPSPTPTGSISPRPSGTPSVTPTPSALPARPASPTPSATPTHRP
jgi:hypothetical protein